MTAIADAIRGKTGGTNPLTLDQMATEIAGITGGGGNVSAEELKAYRIIARLEKGELNLDTLGLSMVPDNLCHANPRVTSMYWSGSNSVGIGNAAFQKCANLVSVDLPNLVALHYASAFNGCTALETVNLPKAERLGSSSFESCTALTKIDLPSAIKLNTLAFYKCTALKTVMLRANSVCTLANVNVFNNTPFASGGTGGTVYVPAALIESYQTATNWSTLYASGTCNFVAIEGSEYE
jgi:hypothetical protein